MFNCYTLLDFIYGIKKEVLRGIYGRKRVRISDIADFSSPRYYGSRF